MTDRRKTALETQTQTNIWQDILRDAMSKRDLEESHVFVFGDKFVGKHALVKIINKELLMKNDFEGKILIKKKKRKFYLTMKLVRNIH